MQSTIFNVLGKMHVPAENYPFWCGRGVVVPVVVVVVVVVVHV